MIRKVILVGVVTSMLAGCQTGSYRNGSQATSFKQLSPANYSKSRAQQPTVIKEYVPVPLPGQLMPSPSLLKSDKSTTPTFLNKEKAVSFANKTAMMTPKTGDFFQFDDDLQLYPRCCLCGLYRATKNY